jgi:arsenite/tail-anchored protein-transporting ATPase
MLRREWLLRMTTNASMDYLEKATRNLFFTGKGGVGKTTLACATAIALADRGKRVLLVSTDPASNLDEVLGVSLTSSPTLVPGVAGLFALNVDPETAASEYRERVVGPYRGVLPAAAIVSMEERLSGSCTVEIAAFDEFSRLLGDPKATAEFDHVLFDTAPTGHTLRLLSLPSAWTGFIAANTTGTSCLGPLAGLQKQRELYRATIEALSSRTLTTLVLVSRPELSALTEAARCSRELASLGVCNQRLVVNGIFHSSVADDPVTAAMERRCRDALLALPETLAALPRTECALAPHNLLGVAALRVFSQRRDRAVRDGVDSRHVTTTRLPSPLMELVNEIVLPGRGVILAMGKGGVGKTTVAAAVAVELARRGHQVHLTTTDPAAHVHNTVRNGLPGLTVSRIDPEAETEAYRAEVMATAGADLDAQGRALLEEDLRSPCTEEIAVFRAFARAVDAGREGYVVLDTAPTGHTILLLDAALAYHRELSRQANEMPSAVRDLLPRLRDSRFTRVLLVTLPEATPVHEAAKLQEDLRRAQICPFAWIVNQSLSPLEVRDPVLIARKRCEDRYIHEVLNGLGERVALVPWLTESPVGAEKLRATLTFKQYAETPQMAEAG